MSHDVSGKHLTGANERKLHKRHHQKVPQLITFWKSNEGIKDKTLCKKLPENLSIIDAKY